MNTTEVLQHIAASLDRSGIRYMLTGSFASAYYGASRSTQDIDFVIEASSGQLRAFVRDLQSSGYYAEEETAIQALQNQSLFNVIELSRGWKIDLILRKARPFSEEEFRRRQQIDFHGIPLFVASAEDMIIAKLEWSKLGGSQRQLEDVVAILRSRWDSLDQIYLRKWTAELQLEAGWKSVVEKVGLT